MGVRAEKECGWGLSDDAGGRHDVLAWGDLSGDCDQSGTALPVHSNRTEAKMRSLMPVAVILLSSVSAFGKYYEAERYDVTLRLDSQGDLAVTETVVFRFVVGPFQFVFREIAATETDGIDHVQAWFDGRPCALGTGPGEVEISGSSPVMVRWHFAPIMSGSHTFTVQYRATGIMRPAGDSQALSWRVLPQQSNYSIGASVIDLEYPPGVEPQAD